jgi:hypothetical protein
LEEKSRVAEIYQPGIIKEAYRLANGSLALFGAIYKKHSYLARIKSTDFMLKHEQIFDYPTTEGSSWWINAAVPTSTTGEFACVRNVVSPGGTDKSGIAVDFVEIAHQ